MFLYKYTFLALLKDAFNEWVRVLYTDTDLIFCTFVWKTLIKREWRTFNFEKF